MRRLGTAVITLALVGCAGPPPRSALPTREEMGRLLMAGNTSNVAVTSEGATDLQPHPVHFPGSAEDAHRAITPVIESLPR